MGGVWPRAYAPRTMSSHGAVVSARLPGPQANGCKDCVESGPKRIGLLKTMDDWPHVARQLPTLTASQYALLRPPTSRSCNDPRHTRMVETDPSIILVWQRS